MRDLGTGTGPRTAKGPCPVCRESAARPRFHVEGVDAPLVVCERCGTGRFDPLPDPAVIRAYYPDSYYGEPGHKFQPLVETLVRAIGSRHLGFLARALAPGARVLDVGCGRGVTLAALADRGFEVHGSEISAEATRGADPRAEIRIAQHLREAGYSPACFDLITIWHVLEHLPDPRGTLEEAARLLVDGGRLIVAVPNFSSLQARWSGADWFHLDLPRHLFHFPLSALEHLLRDCGFEIESAHHFSLRQNPFGWIQSAFNRWTGLPRNALYTLLHSRAAAGPAPFARRVRLRLWLGLLLGAPLALVATLVETALRSGATVHVVARKRGARAQIRADAHSASVGVSRA